MPAQHFTLSLKTGLTALTALAGLIALPVGAQAAEASEAYEIDTVAEGLTVPWGIAFLPGGDMLVTERSGTLRVIRDGVLDPDPVTGVPDVFALNQGGLLGVALHPDFETNNLIYLSYSAGGPDANATRVARARFDGDALGAVEEIFRAEPDKVAAAHFGGRMAFLNDGTLLVTLGDGFNYREESQLLTSHLGTIVRLNDDGSIPDDNPFSGEDGAKPEIWSYGHRNVQGIAYDAANDIVYAHEHGPRGGDELNVVESGANYGWPIASYGIDYTGAKITPYTEYEGTEQPVVWWTPSIAPSGMTIYTGTAFPSWTGDIFVTALIAGGADAKDGHVQRFNRTGSRITASGNEAADEILFAELGERIRHVASGPDGFLYLLTEGTKDAEQPAGRVLRVRPAR